MLRNGEITAATLNVIRQFLKDNNINCDGTQSQDFSGLISLLPDMPEEEMVM